MSSHGRSDEMACRKLVEVLSDYLEGNLAEQDRRRLEAHLEICPYCVDYVEQFRRTIEAMGSLSADSIPPQRRQELIDAFRGWHEHRR